MYVACKTQLLKSKVGHKSQEVVRTADPSVPVSVSGSRGASPLQADALRPVSDGNCVLATGGGKQPEENDQSVTQVNSIRPGCLASLLGNGEAQTCFGKPSTLRGSVSKRWREQPGGWRRNGRKARYMKQGDLSDDQDPTGEHPAVRDAARPMAQAPIRRRGSCGANTTNPGPVIRQESEDPYERRHRVMPIEQRGPGRWM